jgi:ATP-binding cassette subfamily F protein 1
MSSSDCFRRNKATSKSLADKIKVSKEIDNKKVKEIDNKKVKEIDNKKVKEIDNKKENTKNTKKDKFEIKGNAKQNNNTDSSGLVTLYSGSVEVDINGKTLINSSDIAINSGTKYFVIGNNGVGKTTLLKKIFEELKDKLDILMIDQDIELESDNQTIEEFILKADPELFYSKKRMDELEKIEELSDEESDEYNILSDILCQKEWDKFEAESKRIINGLGFENPKCLVSILSGGKRMILAIGKALLRKPEILILDEPTNHLDLDVVIWLTSYLESYRKTLIVITHQIGLVNSVANCVWYIGNPELTGTKLYTIRGKYDNLLQFIDNTQKESQNKWDKFQKKVEELKKKSTPKKNVEEFIKKEGTNRPPKPYVVNITWDNVIQLSTKNIIEFKDVSFNYEDKPIYSNLNMSMGMGSRIILVGPNGCGKTTMFKLACEMIQPTSGHIVRDERLRVGYYNQQIVDSLPLELNSIEYLQTINDKLDHNQCRTILGKLGIKKVDDMDLPTVKISNLSGGQKARVSFASVQMMNPQLILFDEPTNHLDLESIEGLIKGINNFNGGIVTITHDMYLIEKVENAEIYQVINNSIDKFNGDFDDYCSSVLEKK